MPCSSLLRKRETSQRKRQLIVRIDAIATNLDLAEVSVLSAQLCISCVHAARLGVETGWPRALCMHESDCESHWLAIPLDGRTSHKATCMWIRLDRYVRQRQL